MGLIGFGGPVALVGQMERELVGERKWLTKEEMREGIAVCQSLPGPLAIQVGIWISYIRGGFWGAWAGGWAFILPNFVIVTVLGALYIHFGGLSAVKAIFYGVSPAVIALILHSCYRLTKLGMKDWLEWALAAAAFVITVAGAGRGRAALHRLRHRRRALLRLALPRANTAHRLPRRSSPASRSSRSAPPRRRSARMLGKLFTFFLKAGSLTFGSGLVIVPFLEKGLVQQTGWLNEREFLVAVAMGMISPGPVVITATFVGYLVAGFWGVGRGDRSASSCRRSCSSSSWPRSSCAIAPNPNVQGFIKGAYAAAIGTILGACVLLWEESPSATGSPPSLPWSASSSCSAGRSAIPSLVAAAAVVGLYRIPTAQTRMDLVKQRHPCSEFDAELVLTRPRSSAPERAPSGRDSARSRLVEAPA